MDDAGRALGAAGFLENARFDAEGRLFIADEALAREIQRRMDVDRRLTIVRDRFPEETVLRTDGARVERTALTSGTTDPTTPGTEDAAAGPQANMMCPCAPQP